MVPPLFLLNRGFSKDPPGYEEWGTLRLLPRGQSKAPSVSLGSLGRASGDTNVPQRVDSDHISGLS